MKKTYTWKVRVHSDRGIEDLLIVAQTIRGAINGAEEVIKSGNSTNPEIMQIECDSQVNLVVS